MRATDTSPKTDEHLEFEDRRYELFVELTTAGGYLGKEGATRAIEILDERIPFSTAPEHWPCRQGCARVFLDVRARDKHERRDHERPKQHGRVSTYTDYACRCPECKEAMNDYRRKYRARKKKAELDAARG